MSRLVSGEAVSSPSFWELITTPLKSVLGTEAFLGKRSHISSDMFLRFCVEVCLPELLVNLEKFQETCTK